MALTYLYQGPYAPERFWKWKGTLENFLQSPSTFTLCPASRVGTEPIAVAVSPYDSTTLASRSFYGGGVSWRLTAVDIIN